MKTITQKVYTFKELSPKAKERAKDDMSTSHGYLWKKEAFESTEALAEHFGARIDDYSFDFFGRGGPERLSFHFYETHDGSEDGYTMPTAEIERRLKKLGSYNKRTGRGNGDCVLTGYCMDEDAIDGFRQAWRAGERDPGKLLRAGFSSWLKAAQDDCACQYSDEGFQEIADANDWMFYGDGGLHR